MQDLYSDALYFGEEIIRNCSGHKVLSNEVCCLARFAVAGGQTKTHPCRATLGFWVPRNTGDKDSPGFPNETAHDGRGEGYVFGVVLAELMAVSNSHW